MSNTENDWEYGARVRMRSVSSYKRLVRLGYAAAPPEQVVKHETTTEQILKQGFEIAMSMLYPNDDVMCFKDNTYRNHLTHKLFMLYCSGVGNTLPPGSMEYFEKHDKECIE